MPRQPEGYHTLNPILRVGDAAAALRFYKAALVRPKISGARWTESC